MGLYNVLGLQTLLGFLFQITSGEYIQMSGRAGRRGLDERGIVMLMVDEQMDSSIGKELLKVTFNQKLKFVENNKSYILSLLYPSTVGSLLVI